VVDALIILNFITAANVAIRSAKFEEKVRQILSVKFSCFPFADGLACVILVRQSCRAKRIEMER